VIFASIASFWVFRPEVITHSVGSLALATRPLRLVAAPIVFGAGIAFCAWVGSVGLVALLTTATPQHLGLMTFRVAAACVGASAAGVMFLTISPQPGMIIASYLSCLVLVPVIEKSKPWIQLSFPLVAIVVCTAIAAFLMERRCAS
jgi:hypothetical protein